MIDEAVFYNFTLTSYTIRNHFENTKSYLLYTFNCLRCNG